MGHDEIHELSAAYALNALDPGDEAEFESHLARCAACREEVASLQEAATALAFATEAPEPRPGLRARIVAQAQSERPAAAPRHRRWLVPSLGGLAATASVAAVALGIWSAGLSSTIQEEREARENLERATAILAQSDADAVGLSGAEGTLVVSSTGEAAIIVSNLDPAPADKTYEAWVIEGGTPRPAGTFDARGARTVFALERPVAEGTVVAVTLEPEGGVDQPTTTPLFTAQPA